MNEEDITSIWWRTCYQEIHSNPLYSEFSHPWELSPEKRLFETMAGVLTFHDFQPHLPDEDATMVIFIIWKWQDIPISELQPTNGLERIAKNIMERAVTYERRGINKYDKYPSISDNFVLSDAMRFRINREVVPKITTYRRAVTWRRISKEITKKYEDTLEQRWAEIKEELKQRYGYDEYETGIWGNHRVLIVDKEKQKHPYLWEYLSKGRGIGKIWFFKDNNERIQFKKEVSRRISDIIEKIVREIFSSLEVKV